MNKKDDIYCEQCSSCGEDGCCSALGCAYYHMTRQAEGTYCSQYFKDIEFMYILAERLYDSYQDEDIFDDVYNEVYGEEGPGHTAGHYVWEALYNPMTEESSARTISVHLTKQGAEQAIAEHKEKIFQEHQEVDDDISDIPGYQEIENNLPNWDTFKWWGTNRIKVEPN